MKTRGAREGNDAALISLKSTTAAFTLIELLVVAFTDQVGRHDLFVEWTGPPYSGAEPYFPHQDGMGASFCDGHVERFTRRDIVEAQGARNAFWGRWNRDYQSHPEVWRLP